MTDDSSRRPERAPDQHTTTNAERIRAGLRDAAELPSPKVPPDRDQTVRSLQLGLEVQRNQMQRSLTHACLGAALSVPLLVMDDSGRAGWVIGVLLVVHTAIQVFDFHRALGYYNHGVDRLNAVLHGRRGEPPASGESSLWLAALREKPHAIAWPEQDKHTGLSSRSDSVGKASS